ncbi:hypothetical protein CHS0354_037760 [Potamilus streckersoni]|uniref:Peroxidase n=1 Tax=Potamilus streckersoni TaxID=2493646 RepID=A0AAE0W5P0_9BIVA|nr:hypothetical protein CHS0354_037760 [Potamilus streckersoni]
MPGIIVIGDNRIHILPSLATVQVIFLREHNRIASILGKINPHWDDEIIFQETRKIIAAIVQHVAYMEYLPQILGPIIMKKYGLYSTPKGFNTVYNPAVDPTTANAFGAAAYRFGHSLIPGELFLYNNLLQQKAIKTEYTFNRPTALMDDYGRGADNICRWLFRDGAAKSDRFLEPGLRDNLFLDEDGDSFDLAAVNIQRGRDHGIPRYNAWREWCGLPVAVHFGSGPGGLVDLYPDAAMLMSKLYRNPDDIDLYAAGLSERHVFGGSVGPTFACIIGHQFKEWKQGDRFWYENMFPGFGFTLPQLNQIKKYTMAKMTCRNMNNPEISHNVFLQPSDINPLVPCDSLPDLNLNFWRQFPKLTNPFVPETMLFTELKFGNYF